MRTSPVPVRRSGFNRFPTARSAPPQSRIHGSGLISSVLKPQAGLSGSVARVPLAFGRTICRYRTGVATKMPLNFLAGFIAETIAEAISEAVVREPLRLKNLSGIVGY